MLNRNYLCLCTFLLVVLAACSKKDAVPEPPPPPPPPPAPVFTSPPDIGFKIVGYVPNYRDPATIPDVKFRMTNVINYAFATINASGVPVVNNPTRLTAVTAKAKANNCKIFISLNGSTTDWKNMAKTASGRNNYIKATMNIVRQYQLHGVDVDWEYPTTSDGSDTMFTALIKEFADSCHLDGKYYLTAAITPGRYSGGIRDAIKAEVFAYFDWMNVMAYDDFSSSVSYRQHSPYSLAEYCLNYWINTRGMPKAKCVLGLPGYGRGSGPTLSGLSTSYAAVLTQFGGSSQSDSCMVTNAGWPTPFMTYYNGQPTIKKKTMLAKSMANGVMLWEKGQDSNDSTSLLKAVNDTLARVY
jgi:chitinase